MRSFVELTSRDIRRIVVQARQRLRAFSTEELDQMGLNRYRLNRGEAPIKFNLGKCRKVKQ